MARGCCVCPVTLECFLLPSKRKKTQLRRSLNSMQGAGGTDLVAQGGSAGTWVELPVFAHLGARWGQLSARALGCVLLGPPRATSDARGGRPHPDRPQHGVGGGVAASDRPPQCPLHSQHTPRVVFWPRMGFWNCHLLPYFFPFIPQPYIPNPVVSICMGGSGAVGGSPDSWRLGLCL